MRKPSLFWILSSITNNVDISNYDNWSFFTTNDVLDGKSPLKDLGRKAYVAAHSEVSLYDGCLWLFNEDSYESEDASKLKWVLKLVSESHINSLLITEGALNPENDQKFTLSPPSERSDGNPTGSLTNSELKKILSVTERICNDQLTDYENFYLHLSRINKSKLFIKQLALWAFIEQHWNKRASSSESSIYKSLKNLLDKVYEESDPKREDLDQDIKNLSTVINGGEKENYLSAIRHNLAHGRFIKDYEKWEDSDQDLFHSIHDRLQQIVLNALGEEVLK